MFRVVAPGSTATGAEWISRIRFCSDFGGELEKGFEKAGVYDLYTRELRSANPWTVDNEARKKFLRVVFADETDEVRQKRKQDCLLGKNRDTEDRTLDQRGRGRNCAADEPSSIVERSQVIRQR